MDANALLYFTAVVEAQSFQQAARRLNLPKSTLSRKIAELEADLGALLLNRTTRKLSLTELGHQVYGHSQRMDDVLNNIVALAQESSERPQGLLRLSAPITLGRLYLGGWMVEFNHLYPEIALDLRLSDRFEDLVAGQIDIAIRVGNLEDSSLISRELITTPRWLIAASEYLKNRHVDKLEDLATCQLIGLKVEPLQGDSWPLFHKGNPIQDGVHANIYVNDMLTLIEMVKEGGGIGLIPRFAARGDLESGTLHQVLPEYVGPTATFHLVYHRREHLPRKTRLFIEFILDKFKQNGEVF